MEINNRPGARKPFLVPVVIMVIMGGVSVTSAGTWRYTNGWIYWAGFTAITFLIGAYFSRHDRALLLRRTEQRERTTVRKPPAFLNLFFLGFVIPGIDFRFGWSYVPFWLVGFSDAVVFFGYMLVFLVFRENSFASSVITVESAQPVITTGPYAIVRHPMYLGLLLMFMFTAPALGSYWGILPFLMAIPMNVIRIRTEEETLLSELPGYAGYCARTPYRLVPYVW